jgi:CheY-like chemotaxis protein/DNA-directed RNA polymerase subunit RPC12/RpoP
MSLNLSATSKILIIQPDEAAREMLVEIFKANNFEVLVATDGADGFSKANSEEDLDVVLTALNMPRIDGREFLERKKTDEFLKNVPVVIYDNLRDEEEKEELLSAGAKDFIIQGTVAPDKLVQRVARAMQRGDYFFQIDPYALDAQKFLEDHHLAKNFKCTNCGADLAMKITIGEDKNMKASIGCPDCGKQYL